MIKTITILILTLFCVISSPLLAEEKLTISGYIKDKANGEGMIGASVYVREAQAGTVTNAYGFYSLTLPRGNYTLLFRSLGYNDYETTLNLSDNVRLDVELAEETLQMEEVVVSAERVDQNVTSMEMSVSKLDVKTLKRMPAFLGEVDVIRSILLLPGVSTVGEGASGFNVRGGGVDQNLILLDESPVYNSSHLFGFFSVFNPDAVKDVKLMKGGIPAQYGGRLSSLLDVRMKEGNYKEFGGTAGIGTVSSRVAVEGPIVKEKGSFIVAGRRSYADLFLKLSPDTALRQNQAFFYDFSAKANYKFNEKNTLFLSGYWGRDKFIFQDIFEMGWGNRTGTIRWNHLFSERLFANFTGIVSDYDYLLGSDLGTFKFTWESSIVNVSPKVDLSYFISTNHTLNFGASTIFYTFDPGKITTKENSVVNNIYVEKHKADEYAAYVDHEWKISPRLSTQYGVRLSAFAYKGPRDVYTYLEGALGEARDKDKTITYAKGEYIKVFPNLEPRISFNYSIDTESSLKLSYNRMVQYVHLISNTTASSPLDVWWPSTNNTAPEYADQIALGYFKNFNDNTYETSVEVYYKEMRNQLDYINGADLLLNPYLEGQLLYNGLGRSYGSEFYVKKNKGNLTGWVSYTLSKTERKFEALNKGEWYNAKYDKTHNLAVVGIYEINPRWAVSTNFTYSTGVVTTFPNGGYEFEGVKIPHNTEDKRNNYRVPAYHRLDLGATLTPRKNEGRSWQSNWVFSVYNVYARKNAFSIYFRESEEVPNKTEAVRLAILGTFVPAVTYNITF